MNSKGKKNNNNARKTYFRIKSAGNARPEKECIYSQILIHRPPQKEKASEESQP